MEIKSFNKWDSQGIKVTDPGLVKYINLNPVLVPKTGARYAKNQFHKSKLFIVERLINKLMVPGHKAKKHKVSSGHCTGKSQKAYKTVQQVFEKIEHQTKQNPIEVFIRALENAAPREEILTIEYGGARYPKSVECAPQRRIDIAIKIMIQGSYGKSFNTKKSIVDSLTEEILAAYKLSQNSVAISKKLDLERQADASR